MMFELYEDIYVDIPTVATLIMWPDKENHLQIYNTLGTNSLPLFSALLS